MTDAVRGSKELIKALQELEPKVSKKILRTELKKGAKEIAEVAKELAPTGPTGVLERSIKVKSARGKRGQIGFNAEIAKGKGEENDGWYGAFVDLGTEHQKAQHFMERAFDAKAEQLADEIVDRIWAGIEAAWKS